MQCKRCWGKRWCSRKNRLQWMLVWKWCSCEYMLLNFKKLSSKSNNACWNNLADFGAKFQWKIDIEIKHRLIWCESREETQTCLSFLPGEPVRLWHHDIMTYSFAIDFLQVNSTSYLRMQCLPPYLEMCDRPEMCRMYLWRSVLQSRTCVDGWMQPVPVWCWGSGQLWCL